MKCTNRYKNPAWGCRGGAVILTACLLLTGCGAKKYEMPYTTDSTISSYRMVTVQEENRTAEPFAANLCIVPEDITKEGLNMDAVSGAALFSLSNQNTIYAKNVYKRLYPASMTKVMTALVALKNASPDMMLTASSNVNITESGAQLCGLKQGDQMTLSQALHIILINSANDAAVMIAEGVAGSVEGFAEMMNQEARRIGATNSHFVNPHGLSDDDHYTTVYDMYLILNEAVKYEMFNEIIHMSTYTTSYTNSSGNAKDINVKNTNQYLTGAQTPPERVTVIGGKTGNTSAAGQCLALVSRDASGKTYISIIMQAENRDSLYEQMTALLGEIN